MRLPSLSLFIPAFLLSSLSLLITISISPHQFTGQLIFFLLSLTFFVIISQLDINLILVLSPFFYLINILLLVLTLIFGTSIRGSARWLVLGPIQIQSSELAKISLITIFAYLSTKISAQKAYGFFTLVLLLVFISLLILIEPDLGSTVMLFSLGSYLIFNLKPAFRFIVFLLLITAVILPISYHRLRPYQRQRLESFLSPDLDPLGASYNQIQAVIAVGSGQLLGKGLGQGTQSHLRFLPEKETDFFFASTVEELGFLGSAFIISLYLIISLFLIKLSVNSKENELKLVFLGTFFIIFFQAMIHIGINIGILPVTGITLPFMSIGGSSLISFWLLLAIASSAACQTHENSAYYLK